MIGVMIIFNFLHQIFKDSIRYLFVKRMKMHQSSVCIILLFIFAISVPSTSFKPTRIFRFRNNCDKTIWIGGFGVPLMAKTGWEMPPHTE
jgi:hypothetical protein